MVPNLGICIFSRILNITISFSNSSPKIPKSGIFGPKKVFRFAPNFATRQIQGLWFRVRQYFFQIAFEKYPNKTFLVPNLGIFIFLGNFAITQIPGCWFQIWQHCFQIPAQKYPNNAFLVPNFVTRQNQGRWFQIWQYVFQIPAEKCPNKVFWVPNLGIWQPDKFEDADFKYDNSFLKIPVQKYPNQEFLVSNLRIIIFAPNFAKKQIRWFQIGQWCFQITAQKYAN